MLVYSKTFYPQKALCGHLISIVTMLLTITYYMKQSKMVNLKKLKNCVEGYSLTSSRLPSLTASYSSLSLVVLIPCSLPEVV